MLTADRKLRVFLSYAKEDFDSVHEIYNRLKNEGWIEPWQDKSELLPGEHWTAAIKRAIDAADAVIIFLSDNSINKEGFVHYEMNYAWDRSLQKPPGTIYRIPIRLDECDVPEDLYELDSRQWVDYFGEEKDETYRKLLMALQQRQQQRDRLEAKERARAEAQSKKLVEERERKEKEELDRRIAEDQLRKEVEERTNREVAERARNLAEEKERREKEELKQKEMAEKLRTVEIARQRAKELNKRINTAVQFERAGELESALQAYFEVRNIDPTYPDVEIRINELKKVISVREEKSRREFEELTRKKAEEKARKEAEDQRRLEAEALTMRQVIERERARRKEEEPLHRQINEMMQKEEELLRRQSDDKRRKQERDIARKEGFAQIPLATSLSLMGLYTFNSSLQPINIAFGIFAILASIIQISRRKLLDNPFFVFSLIIYLISNTLWYFVPFSFGHILSGIFVLLAGGFLMFQIPVLEPTSNYFPDVKLSRYYYSPYASIVFALCLFLNGLVSLGIDSASLNLLGIGMNVLSAYLLYRRK